MLFGPHMENFHDSVQVLVGRGGIQVNDAEHLWRVMSDLLARPESIDVAGRAGAERGAAGLGGERPQRRGAGAAGAADARGRMKVLHLLASPCFTGPAESVAQLALAQRRLGHEVSVAVDRKRVQPPPKSRRVPRLEALGLLSTRRSSCR